MNLVEFLYSQYLELIPIRGVDPVLKVGGGGGRGTILYIHICMYNIYIYIINCWYGTNYKLKKAFLLCYLQ